MRSERVQRDFETFKKNIEPFLDQWRSLDIRAVAIEEEKEGQSFFRNVATTITLLPSAFEETKPVADLPDLGWLKALHESRPIEDLSSILAGLAADGAIKIKNLEVGFISNDSSAWFGKNQRGERYTSSPKDWTYYSLALDSKFARSFDPRKTDEELKGSESPFLSLDALVQEFPLWRGGGGNFAGLCQINAIFGMRIADSRWRNKKLKILIERTPAWDFKEVDLGLIYTLKSGSKFRKSQQIEQLTLNEEGRLEVEIEPPEDLVTATILLRTRKNTVDETTVFHPALNPRLSLYDVFDSNLEKLPAWFSLEGEGSRDFEKAIETLLFLCGYSVAPFVRPLRQEGRIDIRGVDCLAVDPKGNLFVIECTTGPVDSDKIEKLRHRNNSLGSLGYQASPVLFTTVKRESVSSDVKKKAQDNKISIMTREDIDMLLSMAKRNAHPDEISRFIYQCIPSSFPVG